MKRWLIALILLGIPALALSNWLYLPGPGYSVGGSAPSPSASFSWSATSDSAEVPSGKTLIRAGVGTYITSGCYLGTCYDNVSTASSIRAPIVAGDIIDISDFKLNVYFNPQTLVNYGYVFGVGADAYNAHLVHMYSDGKLYCRTRLNSTQYFGYILNTGSELSVGTWYKLTYEYSAASQFIKVYINDVLKLTINSVSATLQGTPGNIYFSANYEGEGRVDMLIDEVTIE